jgi:hypothetical protein
MAAIKIVACIELNYAENIQVQDCILPDWLEGYTSHDLEVGPVKGFLQSKKLPWSEEFVSVFILLPDDDPTRLHEDFGYCFELDLDEVLPSLMLVCSDDIQNCASNKRTPKFYANLSGMSDSDKIANLVRALRASDGERAEGRINRLLRLSDVRPLTPGK